MRGDKMTTTIEKTLTLKCDQCRKTEKFKSHIFFGEYRDASLAGWRWYYSEGYDMSLRPDDDGYETGMNFCSEKCQNAYLAKRVK